MSGVPYHAWTHAPKARGGTDPIGGGVFEIKVFPDENLGIDLPVASGDGKFIFAIPKDLDGTRLRRVEEFVTTVSSSGAVQVQLRNITQTLDMLATRVQVDSGEFHSKDSGTQVVIEDPPDSVVEWADLIAIDVDQDGTDAWGLGVILEFS